MKVIFRCQLMNEYQQNQLRHIISDKQPHNPFSHTTKRTNVVEINVYEHKRKGLKCGGLHVIMKLRPLTHLPINPQNNSEAHFFMLLFLTKSILKTQVKKLSLFIFESLNDKTANDLTMILANFPMVAFIKYDE
ncbi:CLUMA_CG001025, isoform A [Clunio marinus]|uniref:CLUMA_CG001025, isoform A n=1 Tax=Clunio marinus TaxID=568069 RepID=A0A1J1HGU5_9DIPT|nr:CLUMA_CG001025, isoform A [Clunio marinus]